MRALAWFWAGVLLLTLAGGGFLQWHGAPPQKLAMRAAAPAQPMAAAGSAAVSTKAGGPIAPPDPALLEASKDYAGGFLPRIGPDRRSPSQVYAAGADAPGTMPMVAILLAGIGMSIIDSDQAIIATPAAVSLAVSPYAVQPETLLAEARQRGHEYFLSIPMEPRAYPLDDPGRHALLTGNAPAANDQELAWALTRFGGYVGATGALGALHGERFAESPSQLDPVLQELSSRGLLYVDPRPGSVLPSGVAGRAVDVVIDQTPGAPEIDTRLARLEDLARSGGTALGLVSIPRPVAVERLVAWAAGLRGRGLILVPVSEVIRSPIPAQQAVQ